MTVQKFKSWSAKAVRDPKGPYRPKTEKDKKKAMKRGETKHKSDYQ